MKVSGPTGAAGGSKVYESIGAEATAPNPKDAQAATRYSSFSTSPEIVVVVEVCSAPVTCWPPLGVVEQVGVPERQA